MAAFASEPDDFIVSDQQIMDAGGLAPGLMFMQLPSQS